MSENVYKIALASNFTIEPVQASLKEALTKVDGTFEVEIAPFNQIFQQLADPSSLFNKNISGANAIFLRVADLIDNGAALATLSESDLESISRAALELSDWLKRPRVNSSPLFVLLTPSLSSDATVFQKLKNIENEFASSLMDVSNLFISQWLPC